MQKTTMPGGADRYRDHRPTHRADSLTDIDIDELIALGVRAVLLDMDNTVSTWKGRELAPDALDVIAHMRAAGLDLAVFSNNQPHNVERLAKRLGIDHAIARAGKPRKKAFIKAAQRMGVPPEACCVVGDQLMTDIVGGNRAGYAATILVRPLSPHEWIFTKFNRMRERRILKRSGQEANE